jgi:hypothetical protein
VAGFVASEAQWLAFEPLWKECLMENGLGEIFHMTDFEAQKRKDRGIILEKLTGIINDNTTGHFSCTVDMSAYRKVNEVYPLEEFVGTPYSIATRGVIRNMNLWLEKEFKDEDRLLVFVEEGTKHHGDMEEAFRRDSLPVPTKVPKSNCAVHPADILAWEINHYERFHDNRKSFNNLLAHGYFRNEAHGKFKAENMIRSCKQMKVPLRKDLPPGATFAYNSSPKRLRRRTIQ